MNNIRMIAVGAAALMLSAVALPASAQHYGRSHDRGDRGDVVAGLVIGAVVGDIAGAAIGDGDDRYVAGGALAGAALGAAVASDGGYGGYRSYGSYGYGYGYPPAYSYGYAPTYSHGGYRQSCDYWREGRCWRNRGHWEREHGINSRDGYDRYERHVMRGDRRDWRSDRRHDRRDRRDDRRWRSH